MVGRSCALGLGCGTGDVAAFLATDFSCRVVGADVDPAQVDLARGRQAGLYGIEEIRRTFRELGFVERSLCRIVRGIRYEVAWEKARPVARADSSSSPYQSG